jgi:hypothetical protein
MPVAAIGKSQIVTSARAANERRCKMKHKFSRELYAYWNERRGTRVMPDRADIDPGALRRMLGDSFVLAGDAAHGHPFRLAGTKLCALFGRELRGHAFSSIWDGESTAEIGDVLAVVTTEAVGVAAGAAAEAACDLRCDAEILLLPLAHQGRNGARMLGLLVPLERPSWIGTWPAQPLRLGVIRYFSATADAAPGGPLSSHALKSTKRRSLAAIDGER